MKEFVDASHRYGIAQCRRILGEIYLAQGNLSRATDALLTALEALRNCGDRWMEAEVALAIADIYLEMGCSGRAAALQWSSMEAYVRLNDTSRARAVATQFVRSGARSLRTQILRRHRLAECGAV
jgi:hypothetical protein